MKVYISSTYQDLKEYRAAAALAVRKLGLEAVGMEAYSAADERPLDRCLKDVRRCDLYVGLFGWRAGYQPPGQRESITALEYREAKRSKRRCLLFLLDESVKEQWPQVWKDGPDTAIDALRAELSEESLVATFLNPHHLQAEVTAALAPYAGSSCSQIPDLLPWLVDREPQENDLRTLLEPAQGPESRRPHFVVVHGRRNEAPAEFMQRVARHTLPECFAQSEKLPFVHEYATPWSSPKGGVARRLEDLVSSTHRELNLPRAMGTAPRAVRAQWLARHKGPVFVRSTIHTSTWQPEEAELIQRWADWWAKWPDAPADRPLVVALGISYHDPVGLWARLREARRMQGIRTRIEGVRHSSLLPELEPVPRDAVDHWIDAHVSRSLGRDRATLECLARLRAEAHSLYEHSAGGRRDYVPMEELGSHLTRALRTVLVHEDRGLR